MSDATTGLVQSMLGAAGDHAGRIEALWWPVLALLLGVYALVMAALALALLRRRARDHQPHDHRPYDHRPEPQPETAGERRLGTVVGTAVAATAVVLLALTVLSFLTDRGLAALGVAAAAGDEAVTIEVTPQQWWWQVRYRDEAHPSRSFTTANEIHIPVGTPVRVELKGQDVIHSFWVPTLAGKLDAIPGQTNVYTIRAGREGRFRGQCAEFCGWQHAKMAFLVVAEPRDAFAVWRDAQIAPAAEPATDEQRRGRAVFLGGPCLMCHAIRGTEAGARTAPDLTHLASRATIAAGTLPNTRGHLAAWIADPQGVKPGNHMPITTLPPQDAQALLSYLESLR